MSDETPTFAGRVLTMAPSTFQPVPLSEKAIESALKAQVRAAAKDAIAQMIDEYMDRVPDLLSKCEKEEGAGAALDRFLKLLEFGLPKLARREVVGEDGKPQEMIIRWDNAGRSA